MRRICEGKTYQQLLNENGNKRKHDRKFRNDKDQKTTVKEKRHQEYS